MSFSEDKLSLITRAGLMGLLILGLTGFGLYIASDDPVLERIIVIAFLTLVSVLIGAVIAIESRKDRR